MTNKNENTSDNWSFAKNLALVYFPYFVLLVASLILVFFVYIHQGNKEQIVYANKPKVARALKSSKFKKLPRFFSHKAMPPDWRKAISESARLQNEQFSTVIPNRGLVWVPLSYQKSPSEGVVVLIEPAPKKHRKFKDFCSPLQLHRRDIFASRQFGWVDVNWDQEYSPAHVYFCLDKIKQAHSRDFQDDENARSFRYIGIKSMAFHEMGHLFFPEHVQYGCKAMCETLHTAVRTNHLLGAVHRVFSSSEMSIFSRHILPRLKFSNTP